MKQIHNPYEEVESLHLFAGMTLKILLSGAETGGQQAVFEDVVDPGLGPERHIHHQQDETFIFMEGTFDVEIDGEMYRMNAGDTAFIPKGKIHGWKNVGKGVGRLRYIFSPALNIEQMFRDIDKANASSGMTDEFMEYFIKNYPEQEIAGPPL